MKQAENATRCAIYTRKSCEEGLEQDFNSLHAQREACEAYIMSQKQEGWKLITKHYDDGGFSGGNMDRPGLRALMDDIAFGRVDVVVVYKVDRLTRALADFAKIVEQFDAQEVSFVSVTQQFNTTTSMGRLTLNVLLSFAQFEREVTGERIRDKIAASKKKGMWMGGVVPVGYTVDERKLHVNEQEAEQIRFVFETYIKVKSVFETTDIINKKGFKTKQRTDRHGTVTGGIPYPRHAVYRMLNNPVYIGKIVHKDNIYDGEHQPIISQEIWDEVQAILKKNLAERLNGVHSKRPSILARKVYDDNGNYMSPKHGLKGDKRYRYYTSRAIINGQKDLAGKVSSIPAYELEEVVTAAIREFFTNKERLLELHHAAKYQDMYMTLAELLVNRWEDMQPQEHYSIVQNVVAKVILHEHHVEVYLSKGSLCQVLQSAPDQLTQLNLRPGARKDWIRTVINTRIRRFRSETKMVIAPAHDDSGPVNPTILKALARAHVWNEKLISGEINYIGEIAKMEGLDDRYVKRIWSLAFLPKEQVANILSGKYAGTLEELLATCEQQ